MIIKDKAQVDALQGLTTAAIGALLDNAELLDYALETKTLKRVNKKQTLRMAAGNNNLSAVRVFAKSGWLLDPVRRDDYIDFCIREGYEDIYLWVMDYKSRTADAEAEAARAEEKLLHEFMLDPFSAEALRKIWSYKALPDGSLVITSYKGNEEEVFVPEKIGRRRVSAIGPYAFCARANGRVRNREARKHILSVEIPEGVLSVDEGAFFACSALKSISLPNSLIEIGKEAFYACSGLKSVSVPRGVKSLGVGAFYGCSGLKSLDIPQGVTYLPERICSSCSDLESIILPTGITAIGSFAFWGCRSLSVINIPSNLKSIGDEAFNSCKLLPSISVPEGVEVIGRWTFYDCRELKSISLPGSLRSFDGSALWGCSSLTEINAGGVSSAIRISGNCIIDADSGTLIAGCSASVIPDDGTVKKIGPRAFFDCSNLESIVIPEGVSEIGEGAFNGCGELKSVCLPESLEDLGEGTFNGCTGLSGISLPQGITELKKDVLRGCRAIKVLNLPDGIKSIGESALRGCRGFTVLEIPDSVKEIGREAFRGCRGLREISIPRGTAVGEDAFFGCYSLKNKIVRDTDLHCSL